MLHKPEGYLIGTPENHEYLSSLTGIKRAMEKQMILESTALVCDRDHTLHFDLFGIRGRMPRSEVQYSPLDEETKDIAILTRVGKPTCFKIIGLQREADGTLSAILSRRRAQMEYYTNSLQDLIPGDILPARITHLETFGAFVDIGCGMIALLPIDAISVSRIAHPKDRLSTGERIHVVIKSMDDRGRIYVSQRELLGTWEENAALFSVGQTVAGIVRSIENYGIFIELAPNLAGLSEWKAGITVGSSAAVYIKSIIPEKMKVKLVIIDTHVQLPERSAPEYFIDLHHTEHIDHWRYSPHGCTKVIETYFGPGTF